MKKLLSLGFALFCLASCSDDDSTPAVSLNNLQKRWYNVSTQYNGGTPAPYQGNLACGKDYLEFAANNVARQVDVTDCQTDPTTTTGTYTASDKTLTTALGGTTVTYDIVKLDSKVLRISTTFNGATIQYNYTSTP
jgi:hypothetical protein